jgi:hypothetical protein
MLIWQKVEGQEGKLPPSRLLMKAPNLIIREESS